MGEGKAIAQHLLLMIPVSPHPNLRWPEPLPEDSYYSHSDAIPSIIAESVSVYNDTE